MSADRLFCAHPPLAFRNSTRMSRPGERASERMAFLLLPSRCRSFGGGGAAATPSLIDQVLIDRLAINDHGSNGVIAVAPLQLATLSGPS